MEDEMACPYIDRCKEEYKGNDMDAYRKNCDCINCALCDRYWSFYDKNYLEKQ